MCVIFLGHFIYWPKMTIVKDRKLRVRSKIFLVFKMVQDYGNTSAVVQAVGKAGHSLSMCILRSPAKL